MCGVRNSMKRSGFTRKPDHVQLRRQRTSLSKAARHTSEERKWQRTVRERDNYTCRRCGKYDPYIHAHHVAPRSRRPDLKYDPDNGICLCGIPCHKWVHDHPIEATALRLLSDETYEKARRVA